MPVVPQQRPCRSGFDERCLHKNSAETQREVPLWCLDALLKFTLGLRKEGGNAHCISGLPLLDTCCEVLRFFFLFLGYS